MKSTLIKIFSKKESIIEPLALDESMTLKEPLSVEGSMSSSREHKNNDIDLAL